MGASIAGALSPHTARRALSALATPHLLRLALVALFVYSVAQYHIPGFGFTALIQLDEERHPQEIPAVRQTTHLHHDANDGQFYAQMAVEPSLTDPAFDQALDTPPYRARRILCSWIAYAAGLGHPAWVLEAYALENAAAWLLLAWWLHRRLPGRDARSLAVWAGTLFCHGLLVSVVCSLLDGPSLLLIVVAMSALERERGLIGAIVLAVSGLARETNLLALVGLPLPWPPSPRRLLRTAGLVLLALLPLMLWVDYLRTIYLEKVLTGSGELLLGFGAEYLRAWYAAVTQVAERGVAFFSLRPMLALTAVTTQAVWLIRDHEWRDPWWRLGIVYALLMLTLTASVWNGHPGAFTRVLLPMQMVFNLRLLRARHFWPLFVLGNLSVLPGLAWLGVPVVGRWL